VQKPKYRKHSLRDLAFAEADGKRTYFPGQHGSVESREAYHRFLADFKPKPRARRRQDIKIARPEKGKATVADLCFQFLFYAEQHYPESVDGTPELVKFKTVIEPLIRQFGHLNVRQFGPLNLKAFRSKLLEVKIVKRSKDRTKQEETGLSRRYINSHLNRVRRIFKWGVSEELVDAEVWQALESVVGLRQGRSSAAELPKRQPVAWGIVEKTLAELSPTMSRMVRLQWLTGCRPQSVCAAKIEQFDFEKRTWSPKHKTEHRGVVLRLPIGPKVTQIVQEQLASSPGTEYLFTPIHACSRRNIRYGLRYNADSYRKAVNRAQDRAKVERWSPHQLRHGRATEIRQTYGLEAAQAVLGHASIDATQIYASKLFELARRVSDETG
jgi:integrase